MKTFITVDRAVLALLICLTSVLTFGNRRGLAAGAQPPGPDRFTVVIQEYTSYEWWLTSYAENKVACSIEVDHQGLPVGGEIFTACGKTYYDQWAGTKTCLPDESCGGYYLLYVNSKPARREVGVQLPAPEVWVSLEGCVPSNSTFRCDTLPTLVLTGEEPIDGEHITGLAGSVNGTPFICDPVCQVDLAPTGDGGQNLEFWAYSSYGDSSEPFLARVRVVATDESPEHGWYVDVLSSQWRGIPLAGCSETWDVFPPVGGVPTWLSTPQRVEDLATAIPYEYLAGHLIQQGLVDASTCSDDGMLAGGLPSVCGMELARSAVNDWQNRFDELIFTSAQDSGIPAQMLKNIFARESQFWPGVIIGQPEVGLGQMTEGGADTTLLWNQPFFEQFCSNILDDATCQKGYPHLQPDQQSMLQGALVKSVNSNCPECSLGIDISRAENSVSVFSETLQANCDQTGMIVQNTYGGSAGRWTGYEDLWRFTLVNYNAGSGCLTLAIWETKRLGETLDWAHLSTHLTPVCQGALDYVNSISNINP